MKPPATTRPVRRRTSKRVTIGLSALALVALILIASRLFAPAPPSPASSMTPNSPASPDAPPSTETFRDDGALTFSTADGRALATIAIEVASTPGAREQGLMGRAVMRENHGMLFLFENAEPRAFWMANTPLPLDIIFLSSDRRITTIHRNTTPFSEESLESKGDAQYVVEVNAGWCDRHGVAEGGRVDWRLR